ncbi:hypothetical protein BH24CHL6_BH24CHL6_03760 [soil metagenome]
MTDTSERLALAAERLVRYPFQAWFYGDSIGFEGLLVASDFLDDRRYAAFAHGFLRAWAARDRPYRLDDNTAPGHVLCRLAERAGDELLLDAGRRLADHLTARRRIRGVAVTFEDARHSLRRPHGQVSLSSEEARILADPGAGIYVDCLHFDAPFLAHLAHIVGDTDLAERALDEALGYGELLEDQASGLYHHFWLERTERPYGLGWGRGQGWALLGLIDVISFTPAHHPRRSALVERVSRLSEAMRRRQRDDGSWSTIVQLPGSGEETSTAAFMAAAFRRGVRLGLLPTHPFAAAAESAWRATLRALDGTGLLKGVSAAVYSSTALEHYAHVPTGFDVSWGQGALLVAAAEAKSAGAAAGEFSSSDAQATPSGAGAKA